MSQPVRVLIVDDHRMFAEALEMLLATEEDVRAMGTVGSAEEALRICDQGCPDVVLMDLDLPGMDGADATRRIKEVCPGAHVVAITGMQDRQLIGRAVRAGISGFVPKTRAADELLGVIRAAAEGEIVLPPGGPLAMLRAVAGEPSGDPELDALERLSPREREILQALADGLSTAEVAERFSISRRTVTSHVGNILSKLGIHSKLEAVLLAVRHRVVRLQRGDGARST
jgi:DNA-binding NarL/FixJ family response regulator